MFRGNEKLYGKGAVSVLTSIRELSMNEDDVETYMQRTTTIRAFHNAIIGGLVDLFPDIVSLDRRYFVYAGRPSIEGSFRYLSGSTARSGRYLILYVRERRSLVTFTWNSAEKKFDTWDKAVRASIESLSFRQNLEARRTHPKIILTAGWKVL